MAFGAAVLLMIGVFMLTPLLSRPLIAAAGPGAAAASGSSGKLARQNAVRNPRRTAATASALMIGLTLITGMTVIGGQRPEGHRQDGLRRPGSCRLRGQHGQRQPARCPRTSTRSWRSSDEVTAVSPLRKAPPAIDGETEDLTGVTTARPSSS